MKIINTQKNLIVLFSIIIATILFYGCEKEDEFKTKEFTVHFKAANLELAEAGPYHIGDDNGWENSDKILSAIVNASILKSTDQVYTEFWAALPYVDEDGDSWYYIVHSGGGIYFYAKCQEGYVWTRDYDKHVKITYRTSALK